MAMPYLAYDLNLVNIRILQAVHGNVLNVGFKVMVPSNSCPYLSDPNSLCGWEAKNSGKTFKSNELVIPSSYLF